MAIRFDNLLGPNRMFVTVCPPLHGVDYYCVTYAGGAGGNRTNSRSGFTTYSFDGFSTRTMVHTLFDYGIAMYRHKYVPEDVYAQDAFTYVVGEVDSRGAVVGLSLLDYDSMEDMVWRRLFGGEDNGR